MTYAKVVDRMVDDQDFLEIQPGLRRQYSDRLRPPAGTLGRYRGQPAVRRGRARSTSTPPTRLARFVRFCNAFNIPLLTFVDVPGFLPGVEQEYGGIIRHGAKMLFAYSAATVPKIR